MIVEDPNNETYNKHESIIEKTKPDIIQRSISE